MRRASPVIPAVEEERQGRVETPGETRRLLVELTRLQTQAIELEARLLTHAEAIDAAVETGPTATTNWLAHTTKATRSEAHRHMCLIACLAAHPITRDAMTAGHVLAEQAVVITAAVDTLPEDSDVREQCENTSWLALSIMTPDHSGLLAGTF